MYRSYLIFLICLNYVYGLRKEFCEYHEEVCLTEGVRQHGYPLFVRGVPGVEPSDPMHFNEIIVDLPDSVYKLHEATMTGFKNCDFEKLKLSVDAQNNTIFNFEVFCPTLTLHSNYEINNRLGLRPKETGICEIVYNNYSIKLLGKYKVTPDENEKDHISITKCNPVLNLQAEAICKYQSDIVEARKSDNYYNKVEALSRQAIMDTIMNKYIQNLKNFLVAIPIEELHFRYVK